MAKSPRFEEPMIVISVRVTPAMRRELRRLAAAHAITTQTLLRSLLRDGMLRLANQNDPKPTQKSPKQE